jgi:hypothetical protein
MPHTDTKQDTSNAAKDVEPLPGSSKSEDLTMAIDTPDAIIAIAETKAEPVLVVQEEAEASDTNPANVNEGVKETSETETEAKPQVILEQTESNADTGSGEIAEESSMESTVADGDAAPQDKEVQCVDAGADVGAIVSAEDLKEENKAETAQPLSGEECADGAVNEMTEEAYEKTDEDNWQVLTSY